MLWLRIVIWVALVALGITVVVVTFRGGTVPQPQEFATDPPVNAAPSRQQGGEMAYDRWRPGSRSDPERLRAPAAE